MSQTQTAIEIRSLTKQFGTFKAVDGLDFSVAKGSIFGFLGSNGAGKTTTIKMIAGLTRPDAGSIRLLNKEVCFGDMHNRDRIGYLPDVPECYGYMKPLEFLCFCGDLYRNDHAANCKASEELLEMVGLSGVNKRIASFSRGMKQRLGIAQALINNPEVVLMDEPASALDPTGRYEVMEIIRKLKGHTTVFFSTHILTDIERVCDEIAIIDQGVILERGPIAELKEKYDRRTILVEFPASIPKEQIDSLVESLSKDSWCNSALRFGESGMKIGFTDKLQAQIELIKRFSAVGVPVESINSNAVSLEDIFLEVVHK